MSGKGATLLVLVAAAAIARAELTEDQLAAVDAILNPPAVEIVEDKSIPLGLCQAECKYDKDVRRRKNCCVFKRK